MGAAALLLSLDQIVKWVVATNLPPGEVVAVTAWFNLVHVLNPGASFSFLADAGGWQRHALIAVGVAVSGARPAAGAAFAADSRWPPTLA
jgi:signal peptidase II